MGWKKIQNLTIGGGGWRGTIVRYSRVVDLEFNARSYFLLVVLLVTPWCWFITLYLLQNHTLLFANSPVDTRRRFNVVTTSYRSWNNAMCLRGHLVLVTCYKLSNNSLQKTIVVNIGCYLCQSLLLKNFYVNNFKRCKNNSSLPAKILRWSLQFADKPLSFAFVQSRFIPRLLGLHISFTFFRK